MNRCARPSGYVSYVVVAEAVLPMELHVIDFLFPNLRGLPPIAAEEIIDPVIGRVDLTSPILGRYLVDVPIHDLIDAV